MERSQDFIVLASLKKEISQLLSMGKEKKQEATFPIHANQQ